MKALLIICLLLSFNNAYANLTNAVRHLATLYPSNSVEEVIIYTDENNVAFEHVLGNQEIAGATYYRLSRTAYGQVNHEKIDRREFTSTDEKNAQIIKALLEKRFGQGSHTNKLITEEYVKDYFVAKSVAGTTTLEDVQDALILLPSFEDLSGKTIDGTIWSYPWKDNND